jgi:hypothetical protein
VVKSEPPSSRLDEVSCVRQKKGAARAAPKLKAARGLGGMVERLTADRGIRSGP